MVYLNKIKIVLAAPAPPPYGGISNWVILMYKHMKNNDFIELSSVIDTSPKSDHLDKRSLWDRVVKQGFRMIKANIHLKKLIKNKKVDILHVTTSGQLSIIRDILLLKTAKKFKIPSVYHIRFGRVPDIKKNNTKEWKLFQKAVELANRVIAIDDGTYCTLREFYGDDKIKKIPNPFDLDSISIQSCAKEDNSIIFVGWCIKNKGIEELLKAWESVHIQFPTWSLKIVGPFEEEYKLKLTSQYSMENVIWYGQQEHDMVLNLLNESDIFILPSYTEGFPNAVLEAMALKKPIIATNVGAIPEMINLDSGILIEPYSVDEIVNNIESLILDKNKRIILGENAYIQLKNNFTIDIILEEYINLWKRLKKEL